MWISIVTLAWSGLRLLGVRYNLLTYSLV